MAHRNRDYAVGCLIAVAIFAVACGREARAAVPTRLNWQARLTDPAGIPLAGSHVLLARVYDGGSEAVAGSGTLLYSEQATVSVAAGGIVSYALGSGAADGTSPVASLAPATFAKAAGPVFLEVSVDAASNVILPRARLESVPFAMTAATVEPGGADARTVIEALPFTITEPGSYFLAHNLTGVAGSHGITVAADRVTIDLNGFSLVGVPGSKNGIHALAGSGLLIKNGCISGWGASGIDANPGRFTSGWLGNPSSVVDRAGGRFVGLTISSNVDAGIYVGVGGLVSQCDLMQQAVGAWLAPAATAEKCIASDNTYGYYLYGASAVVSDCAATSNTTGFWGGDNGHYLSRCTSSRNYTGYNFVAGSAYLKDCASSSDKVGYSIVGGFVEGCAAVGAGEGFRAATGGGTQATKFIRCKASLCNYGFTGLSYFECEGCASEWSGLYGFASAQGAHVSQCSSFKDQCGFSIFGSSNECMVERCSAVDFVTTGVFAQGSGPTEVRGCLVSTQQGRAGILIGSKSTVVGCSVYVPYGIGIGTAGVITDCEVRAGNPDIDGVVVPAIKSRNGAGGDIIARNLVSFAPSGATSPLAIDADPSDIVGPIVTDAAGAATATSPLLNVLY